MKHRLLATLTALLGAGWAFAQSPSVVKLDQHQGSWRLLRDGQPFFIRGAVGWTRFNELAAAGANAVRTGANEKALDEAHRHGLGALAGLPLGIPRHGFDYADTAKVAAQRERIRQIVLKSSGLDEFCPALDAVGLNAYADMLQLPEDLARQNWKRPYLITEFGPRGHWQVTKTAWGARLEDSSTEKAAFYRRAYEHAVQNRPQCLGSFAFLWGEKMEKTHTWYGMFLADGSRTEAVDVMQFLWTGKWPTNRCPTLATTKIQLRKESGEPATEPGVFAPGTKLHCSIETTEPDGDALKLDWDLRRDVADDPRMGGDYEPLEPAIQGAVLESKEQHTVIKLPDTPGKYRIFVYIRDGQGGAATANVPILTK